MIYELVMVWEEGKRYLRRKKWIYGKEQDGKYDEVTERGIECAGSSPSKKI